MKMMIIVIAFLISTFAFNQANAQVTCDDPGYYPRTITFTQNNCTFWAFLCVNCSPTQASMTFKWKGFKYNCPNMSADEAYNIVYNYLNIPSLYTELCGNIPPCDQGYVTVHYYYPTCYQAIWNIGELSPAYYGCDYPNNNYCVQTNRICRDPLTGLIKAMDTPVWETQWGTPTCTLTRVQVTNIPAFPGDDPSDCFHFPTVCYP